MAYPVSPYIEARYGGLYVAGTRVSLDSVVIRFQQGASPEKIVPMLARMYERRLTGYAAVGYVIEPETFHPIPRRRHTRLVRTRRNRQGSAKGSAMARKSGEIGGTPGNAASACC